MRDLLRRFRDPSRDPAGGGERAAELERRRLRELPRYVETVTSLPGVAWCIPDGPSFLASWVEIFDEEIYRFRPGDGAPRILDCGANVGVSVLFFRRTYPNARITAFEPDPKILAYLRANLAASGVRDVEIVPKAVWTSESTRTFHSEGADAGRLEPLVGAPVVEVGTTRLADFLEEPVDFLKLDVEGAETEVLLDCAPLLERVRNLFVEYHSLVGKAQTLDEVLGVLRRAGFRMQIRPVHADPRPFLRVEPALGMDFQANVFAYRE